MIRANSSVIFRNVILYLYIIFGLLKVVSWNLWFPLYSCHISLILVKLFSRKSSTICSCILFVSMFYFFIFGRNQIPPIGIGYYCLITSCLLCRNSARAVYLSAIYIVYMKNNINNWLPKSCVFRILDQILSKFMLHRF